MTEEIELLRPEVYLDYKAQKGKFEYYDKDLETRVELDITPFTIVKTAFALKGGWDSDNNCAYYSNEVDSIKDTELTLKSYRGGEIARGNYSSNKQAKTISLWNTALPEGVKLHKAITALMDGKVIRFYLKTVSMFEFGEVLKTVKIEESKFEIDKLDERKFGWNAYYVPFFKESAKLTKEEKEARLETIKLMTAPVETDDSDLPF